MKNKQEIEQLTNATLNSLNKLQPVEANEFLYAKVMHKMQVNEQQERVTYSRLMVKLSVALGLFICLNGVSFYALQHQQNKTNKTTAATKAAFAEEYSLKDNSYNY
jgi:hypothetical protein